MIVIGSENWIDWASIRAEYIAGTISQRKLAEKWGVNKDVLMQHANREHWKADRDEARRRAIASTQRKSAEKIADNAVLAQELKKKLLQRLARIEAKYPFDATEVRTRQGNSVVIFRLRDLTGAYKEITEGIPVSEDDKNAPIIELLKRLDGECNV